MAKRELHIQKREKALQRVKKFREEEREMRSTFANIKNKVGLRSCSAFASAC
jgi:Golgi SNAP receptor complex protein 2